MAASSHSVGPSGSFSTIYQQISDFQLTAGVTVGKAVPYANSIKVMGTTAESSSAESLSIEKIKDICHQLEPAKTKELTHLFEGLVREFHELGDMEKTAETIKQISEIGEVLKFIPKGRNWGYAGYDQTYSLPRGQKVYCNDRAFFNTETRTVAVFDGAGHNSEEAFKREIHIYREIFEGVTKAYSDKTSFDTVREACQGVYQKTKAGAEEIRDKLSALEDTKKAQGPAIMVAQAVSIQGKKHLVFSQTADCGLAVKKANGTYNWVDAQPDDYGLGDRNARMETIIGEIGYLEIEHGDEVILFTDGIGEFLTKEEMMEIIDNNKPADRLEAFKKRIMSPPSPGLFSRIFGTKPRVMAINPKGICKVWDGDLSNKSNHDDIAIASLKIV